MIVLGLTGSIAMGKSEAARMLRRFDIPVFDSDAAVHSLLAKGGGAVDAVAAAFPGVKQNGAVDRKALGAQVFGKPDKLAQLEQILHPKVFDAQRRFLADADQKASFLAALDIPLLFETGGEAKVDRVAVVSAPAPVQKARALARPGMTEQRLNAVLAQQLPDAEKRRRADYILNSGDGKRLMLRDITAMLRDLQDVKAGVWPWPVTDDHWPTLALPADRKPPHA
ncbi:dephospho-CoA kinase [Iodidimonas muriae]|uniref:Dephospho-CoA kinase n=1 Tax=Iodidimonas muriae TaxID=261467 RepID=A0ABQ2L9E9_9PROT|nr:dephospho-CoA kinase [Iodidimonas muriae]GER05955.1 dephospho-CoA kinase [Kordiimonadales bacterium JCM 17843]GGO07578.1 dephospho-CoA kinase [Iodidimonas muriae]